MSTRIPTIHSDRVDGPFLRAIGGLALASHDLRRMREIAAAVPPDANVEGWMRYADHLLESVDAVLDGANRGTATGNTLLVQREGASVPVGLDYLLKLAVKLDRHARVARALGVDVEADDLTLAV